AMGGGGWVKVVEKGLEKVLVAGVPWVAAPLLSSNCRSTSVDDDWVAELIDLRTEPPKDTTKSYVHLMRAAHQICEEPELSRLAPRVRAKSPLSPPGRGGGGEGQAPSVTNGTSAPPPTPPPPPPRGRE